MKQKYFLKIALFFLLFSNISLGQDILTFDFNGLTGSEATDTSDTNNGNIGISTISRGTGLTASNNGGRFNATSWNTGTVTDAITGNDYMEFTITPNATFQFTVSSIVVNIQRSGSGARAVSLRNSVDSYAANLDAEKVIIDNTSTQTFTFTFAQANSTTAVTYRFYLHAAEGTGGSGGFEGTGNDIIVNGTVTSASSDPSIGFSSATSSVTETNGDVNNGGIPITLIQYDSPNNVTITPTVDGSSTAEAGDYTIDLTPIVFNANETNNIPLTIHADADNDNETIIINFTVTSGTANLGTSQHTVTITDDELPDLVVNELLADPAAAAPAGDSNGDGVRDGSDDEFIEIYNTTGSAIDVSGFTVSDASSVRHTFPSGTIIPANQSIIIFGGGTITGISGLAQKASTGSIGLSNTGDTITIKNASSLDISVTGYGSDANDNQSIARSPDFSGSFVKHTTLTGALNFSPGKDNTDGVTPFTPLVTWDGSDSSVWTLGANWDTGSVPTSINDILIPNGMPNEPTISSSTGAVGINLTINTGGVLTIESGGTLILNRYGISSGNLTCNINIADDKWHLLSSPVVGEQYDDTWVGAPNSVATNGSNRAISTYINTTDNDGDWVYSQTTTTGTFNSGIGYSMKRTATGNLAFTGAFPTSDIKTTISQGFGAANKWNLSGNPFPSYIKASELITANAANLTDTHEFIYVWDNSENGGTGGYKTISGTDYIHTGQGFFVNADNSTADNFVISESLQSDQNGVTFYKKNNPSIKLILTDGTSIKNTNIKYETNSTTGLDPGFDAGTFTGTSTNFNIYTHLVSHNEGVDFMIQSLPNSDFESMIIPIGIKTSAGKEITFTSESLNLPSEIKVFLEDRQNSTFTRLDEANSEYKITLKEALDGVGRFYLHTKSSSVLSTDTELLNSVSIYKTNNHNLKISGLNQGKAIVSIFNMLGKKVMQTSFEASTTNNISLPNLSTGVYVVKLQTLKGKINKKIILE
ncbi:MAG: lamin tail domain-containing protein [Polaribacter sp.]